MASSRVAGVRYPVRRSAYLRFATPRPPRNAPRWTCVGSAPLIKSPLMSFGAPHVRYRPAKFANATAVFVELRDSASIHHKFLRFGNICRKSLNPRPQLNRTECRTVYSGELHRWPVRSDCSGTVHASKQLESELQAETSIGESRRSPKPARFVDFDSAGRRQHYAI